MSTNTPTAALSAAGVSIWLDDLSRERITSGGLAEAHRRPQRRRRHHQPDDLRRRARQGRGLRRAGRTSSPRPAPIVDEAVFEITTDDVRDAADIFRPVYDATDGFDGRVSIEVEPDLAHDTAGTIEQAKALWAKVDRPERDDQDPGDRRGPRRHHRGDRRRHQRQRHADLQPRPLPRGHRRLPRRPRAGEGRGHRPLDASTRSRRSSCRASTPRSTSDSTAIGTDEALALKSKAGVANARLAYELYEQVFGAERATALLAAGANRSARCGRRPASRTPALPDTLYVTELVAQGVVNTMPEKTLEATFDHGVIVGDTVTGAYADAGAVLDALARVGVYYDDVTARARARGRREVHRVVERAARHGPHRAGGGTSELPHLRQRRGRRRRPPHRPAASSPTSSPSGITGQDAELWGPAAEDEASKRLGWTEAVAVSRPLVPEIEALREELRRRRRHAHRARRHGRLVARARGHHPHRARRAHRARLDRARPGARRPRRPARRHPRSSSRRSRARPSRPTASVASTSRRSATRASTRSTRIIVVTDPGSPLDESARAAGYRVFNADPNVGGRYSALTAFGLVPSGLAGVDIAELLDEAETIELSLAIDSPENPGLVLGAAIAGDRAAARQARASSPTAPTSSASPTGPSSSSPSRPARRAPASCPSCSTTDAPELDGGPARPAGRAPRRRRRRPDLQPSRHRRDPRRRAASARSCSCWEYATAVAGRLLGINPFDQPDVESAKIAARGLLDARPEPAPAAFVADGIEVRGTPDVIGAASDLVSAIDVLLEELARERLHLGAGLRRPRRPPRARAHPRPARRTRRPTRHVRLGTALPALDRPVPQGRPGGRRVPADHRGAERGPRDPRSSVHLRRAHRGAGVAATRACSPTTAVPC